MNQRRLGILLFLLTGGVVEAAGLKPITHQSLWMMKRVGASVVSPDGKWAVYSGGQTISRGVIYRRQW